MQERILIAPGINGDELQRNLALHGINSFNLRIMNSVGLARYVLMKQGIPVTEEFVSATEECGFIAKAVEGSTYFKEPTFADISDLTAAIRQLRYLIASDDEAVAIKAALEKGIFTEKNTALYEVYEKYVAELKGIDAIGLIRKAISVRDTFSADFIMLKEFPLRPLETKLLEVISSGRCSCISLAELYNVTADKVNVSSYRNCYGAANEVEMVITDIYRNNIVDSCVVAMADSKTYSQLFFDLAISKNIPVTFGAGIPIVNSNPARLLNLYYKWMTTELFSSTSFEEMVSSAAIDRGKLAAKCGCDETISLNTILNVAKGLRFTNDGATNKQKLAAYESTIEKSEDEKKLVSVLAKLAEEMALSCEDFIHEYSRIRYGATANEELITRLDNAALGLIYNQLSLVREEEFGQVEEDVIKDILTQSVCAQRSQPGYLHICSISDAMISIREHLYVVGLSANIYPGSPVENYLLLDDDITMLGVGMDLYTSAGRVIKKRETLMSLVRLASALNTKIAVSYAGYNVSELKNQNASSLVFDLYREQYGDDAAMNALEAATIEVGYFDPEINGTRTIGNSYIEGSNLIATAEEKDEIVAKLSTDGKRYSPSALSDFFECRRKYMYKRIMSLLDDNEENPFEVISASDQGTMAHELMEELANSSITKDDFLKLAENQFDLYIKQHPSMIENSVANAKEQFLDMMGNAYDADPHRKVVLKEEDKECKHSSGLTIHGFPDRVEQVGDNEYIIVDFKTGRRVKHHEDDIYSCLQVVIYAYLMEAAGYHISRGEFRYLRLGQTITCKYDDGTKLALGDMLTEFMEAIKHNDYPCVEPADEDDPCKYCSYATLCNRTELEGED